MLRRRAIIPSDCTFPVGYKRCQYLHSTGTQWIDTGYVIADKKLCAMSTVSFTSVENGYLRICGNLVDSSHGVFRLQARQGNDTTRSLANMTGGKAYTEFRPVANWIANKKYVFISDALNGRVGFDDILFNCDYIIPSYVNTSNLCLFKAGVASTSNALIKMYDFSLSNQDGLELNLIPCLDASGRPCMYDTVSRKSFYNSGTGEFLYELE